MVDVAMVGDAGVARPIAVMLHALHHHSSEVVSRVHIATLDWTPQDEERARTAADGLPLVFHRCNSRELPAGRRHVSAAAYLVLLLPELLDDVDRVIALDCDLHIQGPLTELATLDLDERPAAGVQDVEVPFIGSPHTGIRPWRTLGVDPRSPVVNTGVLVLDLEMWRQEQLGKRALDLANQHGDNLGWADQAVINVVLDGHWLPLQPHLNFLRAMLSDSAGAYAVFGRDAIDAAREKPTIVHFEGATKPWHAESDHPFTHAWRSVAAEIGWEDFAPRHPRYRHTLRRVRRRVAEATHGL